MTQATTCGSCVQIQQHPYRWLACSLTDKLKAPVGWYSVFSEGETSGEADLSGRCEELDGALKEDADMAGTKTKSQNKQRLNKHMGSHIKV